MGSYPPPRGTGGRDPEFALLSIRPHCPAGAEAREKFVLWVALKGTLYGVVLPEPRVRPW